LVKNSVGRTGTENGARARLTDQMKGETSEKNFIHRKAHEGGKTGTIQEENSNEKGPQNNHGGAGDSDIGEIRFRMKGGIRKE